MPIILIVTATFSVAVSYSVTNILEEHSDAGLLGREGLIEHLSCNNPAATQWT
jgi:hypothetical protein